MVLAMPRTFYRECTCFCGRELVETPLLQAIFLHCSEQRGMAWHCIVTFLEDHLFIAHASVLPKHLLLQLQRSKQMDLSGHIRPEHCNSLNRMHCLSHFRTHLETRSYPIMLFIVLLDIAFILRKRI